MEVDGVDKADELYIFEKAEEKFQMIEDKINSPEVAHHGYVLEGFPSHSESNLEIQKQMQMIKNWKLQPDFIINMRV